MSLKKIILSALIGLIGAVAAAGMSFAKADYEPVMETEEAFTPGFYYTIQEGDTLWDLSRRFYDSEWEWPALWGQNKDIPNPHWIYPGNRIRLYQKTDTLAHRDKARPVPEKKPEVIIVEEEPEAKTPVLPPPPEEPELFFHFPQIALVGFIKDLPGGLISGEPDDPLAIGTIFRSIEQDRKMIGERDTVYIKQTHQGSDFIVGNQYRVYKPLERIRNLHDRGYAGYQYKITGVVEVTDTTPAYVVAEVVRIIRPMAAGDMIMPFPQRTEKIALRPSPEGLTGHVLITEEHTLMSADYDIVFLDKGRQDGVQAGQRYVVFSQEEHRVNGKEVLLPPVVYGKLLVLLAEETTATATITQAGRPVRPGDRFKSP